MKSLLIAGAVMVSASLSESVKVWDGGHAGGQDFSSYVELHEPTVENAEATITFKNTSVHTGSETFVLNWNGIQVTLKLTKDVGNWTPEGLEVIRSDGYVPEPRSIIVQEDTTGQIHLFPFMGV